MAQELGLGLKPRPGDPFDRLTLVVYLVYLAGASLASHVLGRGIVGFVLAPLPLLFYPLDTVRFMLLSLSCYLLFFEAFEPGSSFLWFNTPDTIFAAFVVLRLFFRRDFLSLRVPSGGLLIPLYLFILHGLVMTVPGLLRYGLDFYVLRDLKNLLYLLLVVPLCRRDEPLFDAGNVYRILVAFVLFSAGHALVHVAQFVITGARAITWNEVLISDAILMIAALLPVTRDRRARTALLAALPVCVFGLLIIQTRSLWGSTLAVLLLHYGIRMARSGTLSLSGLLNGLKVALVLAVAAEAVMRVSVGTGLVAFVESRALAFAPQELVDPYSSLGYRIHESLAVWEKRSWFGHGSGARVYLYFTQLGTDKFINWWSIHSEYFELLHKYGFAGLGAFLWFLAVLLRRALALGLSRRAFPSALGLLVLAVMLNHVIVSITSGYLVRENVMLLLVLAVGIVHRWHPRAARRRPPARAAA